MSSFERVRLRVEANFLHFTREKLCSSFEVWKRTSNGRTCNGDQFRIEFRKRKYITRIKFATGHTSSLFSHQPPIERWRRGAGPDGDGRQHHPGPGGVAAGRLPRLHRLRRRPVRALPDERVDRRYLAHDHALEEEEKKSCSVDL